MKKSAFNLFTLFALLIALLGSAVNVTPAYAASIVVNSAADDTLANLAGNGTCDLREAIQAANTDTAVGECPAGSGADVITFADNYTITLVDQLPDVTTQITIIGNGVANTVIQASTCNPVTGKDEGGNSCTPADYRIFVVASAGNLTINGITIRHGKCEIFCPLGDSGGGIYNQGTLTIADSALSDNQSGNGGGIYNISNNLTLVDVTFSNNSAVFGLGGGKGGGLHNINSAPTLTNVTFSENSAFSGGGVYNTNSNPNLKDMTFSGNTAGSSGGGMENDNSSPNLTNVTFSGNKAPDGGGMYNSGSNPSLSDVTFSGNESTAALGCGGGMYNTGSTPILSSVTFSDNDAHSGGGMCNKNSSPRLTNVTFLSNNAGLGGGGGMRNTSSSPALTQVFFLNNSAVGFGTRGGGVYNDNNSSPSLVDVTFSENRASYGGGIFNSSSNPSLTNVTLSGNNAVSGHGGGMHNENSSPRLTNVTFSNNSAVLGPGFGRGGGMYNYSGTPLLLNVIIANSASGGDCVNLNGTLNNLSSNNLIESIGGNACNLTDGSNSNIIGVDPNLNLLADNGGFTQTHALLPGSAAIDAGAGCPTTDQRGVSRPQGAACDIGAYEMDSTLPTVTVEQASGQADPTTASPINFTATFSEPINPATFTASDVTLGGTALGTLSAVLSTSDNITFNIAVSGMTSSGTVIALIGVNKVQDLSGNDNTASTSVDDTVTYDINGPTVISHTLQASYTGTGPISFTVTFSEDVSIATGANSATNVANYRIINKGANGILETAACNASLGGDDTQVTVNNVTYSPNTATVTFASALPVGKYRLLVCGTTSIVDLAGNHLAGDGSTAGTDFPFDFVVAAATITNTGGNDKEYIMPNTGFAPNVTTALPAQPAELAYASLGDLWLEIPSLNVKANIVGVPQSENIWNVSWLDNNVGWLNGSAFPTWKGNSILTAHVTNADGLPGPFAELYKLDYGEQIIVHLYGGSYVFQIHNKRFVRPNVTGFAFEHLEGNSYITLITCASYDSETNTYRHRRIIRAEFVGMK